MSKDNSKLLKLIEKTLDDNKADNIVVGISFNVFFLNI